MSQELKAVVLEAVRSLAGSGLKTPKAILEFRLLVETAAKLEDLGEVEKLKTRVMELENRFNLSRVPGQDKDQVSSWRAPRIK